MLAALVACTGDGDPVLTSVAGQGWIHGLGNGNQSTVQIVEVTFDKNDAAAEGTMQVQKVNANNTVNLLTCDYVSPGKSFAGWATSPLGAVIYADRGAIVVGTNPVALYARWNSVVSFDANGGSTPVPALQTNLVGQKYGSLATTSRAGYAFDGWWTNAGGTGSAEITVNTIMDRAAHTLWAKWSPLDYTVSFNAQGGIPPPDPVTVTSGSLYPLPSVNRPGMTFMGWWTGTDAAARVITATNLVQIASNHTLYARWGYAVTFVENGGSEVPDQVIESGKTVLQPAAPSRNLAVFDGWFKEAGCVTPWNFATDAITSDVTLYAKWLTLADVSYKDIVSVPGGTYTQQDGNSDGLPLASFGHTITGFKMGKYEVTYELWHLVYTWATNNAYNFANAGQEGHDGPIIGAAPTIARFEPATRINWRSAIVWCNAYSQMDGKTPVYYSDSGFTTPIKDSRSGSYANSINPAAGSFDNPYVNWSATGYRLPTAGEWQYAASYRDGLDWTPYNYASGATANYSNATATGLVAWYNGNSSSSTKTVGTRDANALGIHDMSGNVFEWCWDWYSSQVPTMEQTNYRGPVPASFRVIRGGTYNQAAKFIQIGYRSTFAPFASSQTGGFRVVLSE